MTVHLKKRSVARRSQYNAAIAPISARQQDLWAEVAELNKAKCGCGHPLGEHRPDMLETADEDGNVTVTISFVCKHGEKTEAACSCLDGSGPEFRTWLTKRTAINLIDRDEMQPVRLRHFLKSVEGITLDDAPATVDSLIAEGPDELLGEIDEEIKRLIDLSEIERKNSGSPTTSPGVVGGQTPTSTVPTAATVEAATPAVAA